MQRQKRRSLEWPPYFPRELWIRNRDKQANHGRQCIK